MRDTRGNEQNTNIIFVTFYCKWCRAHRSQPVSLEDFDMNMACYYCNNYGLLLSNKIGQREWFRDGLDGKYFGGYDKEKIDESYGGARFRALAEEITFILARRED